MLPIEKACSLVTDGTHYTPPDVPKGIPFLTVKDMTNDGLDFQRCAHMDNVEYQKAVNGNSAPKVGDVLFSKDGTVGKVHVVRETTPFAVLSSIAILRPNSKLLDSTYFGYVLKFPSTLNQATKRKTGSAIRRIILNDLKDVRFPLPPLPEQRRIAAILDKADAIRRKRQQALHLTEDFLRSAFLDLFGDPITIPKYWPRQSLEFVCEKISDGTHHSPPIQLSGVPYITAKHLKPFGLDFHADPWFISAKDHREIFSRCDPRLGDVLYIKDGVTTGLAAINHYDFEFSMLSSLALLRPKKNLCTPQFLCEFLNDPLVKSHMLSHMSGAAIRRLTLAKIKKQEILLPPFELQNKFTRICLCLEKLRYRINCTSKQANKLFNSLSQRAFRGNL